MWMRITGYTAVLLLAVYLYFMYDETAISGILVLMVLYPVCAWLFLLMVRKKISAGLDRVPPMGEKGKCIRAGVTVRNASRTAAVRCEVEISVRNRISGRKIKRRYQGILPPGREETFWCESESDFCGNMEIELESVRICDLLDVDIHEFLNEPELTEQ